MVALIIFIGRKIASLFYTMEEMKHIYTTTDFISVEHTVLGKVVDGYTKMTTEVLYIADLPEKVRKGLARNAGVYKE